MKKIIQNMVLGLSLVTGGLEAQETGTDRVFIKDVAGIWINQSYIKQLEQIKMPHVVAKKSPPLIIAIRRAGNSFPIVVTDFKEAALHVVLDLEPDKKLGSYRLVLAEDNKPISADKVKLLYFRGLRNFEGKFKKLEMAEIFFKKGQWDTYINVGNKIGPFVNKTVIAGRYEDKKGNLWEFSPDGQAYLPDQTFYYELSLRDQTAGCEYIEGEDLRAEDGIKRIGYAWEKGKLDLYESYIDGDVVRCKPKPFETLSPLS